MNFDRHRWINPDNVIKYDIKSYYAYLPATFIHKDIHLKFIDDDYKKYIKMYWPSTSPTGERLIITSMGLSYLYSPFFFAAHLYALNSDYEAEGHSVPYAFALVFSALFYLIIGLFYLRRILLLYFNEITTAITILLIYLGTNLLFYTVYNGPMPHSYNFALLTIFIWNSIKWHENQSIKRTLILGFLLGLIALIRPTNILILCFFILFDIKNFKDISARIKLLFKKWHHILLMILAFIIIWVPQFIYWKIIAGKFIFFSYGSDASFFWDNPQIYNVLFSFRKGWYIYTPIMFIATIGLLTLFRRHKKIAIPILVFLVLFIYTQSSWWCWWFGGSFGQRSFVDIYGVMAIPLASLVYFFIKNTRYLRFFFGGALICLILLNFHFIKKYNKKSIHYWWMSKEALFQNFWHYKPANDYWKLIPIPDYVKARKGVYVAENLIKKYNGKLPIKPQMIIDEIKKDIKENHNLKSCKKQSEEYDISLDSAITIKAWNIYELKSINKYIEPIERELKNKKKHN